MTKTIRLAGGPEHGQTATVGADRSRYVVLRSVAPGKKMILLAFEKGIYMASGQFENDIEIYRWGGWEGDKN